MAQPEDLSPEERELRRLIAENLRRLMADRGHPVVLVADFAAMSRSHLDYILKGQKSPTSDVIARLARALDVPPWQILKPRKRN